MVELPAIQSCRLASGRQVAWREWGSGAPLIMLHGWSMSSVVFSEIAALLQDEFRLLCPDLPGHGASDPLPVVSMEAMAETVVEWAEYLELQQPALLGWSLGGQVALQVAADGHLPVRRLVLVATTPRFCRGDDWPHGLPLTQVRALQRSLGRAYEKTLGDFFRLQFDGEDLSRQRYREIIAFAVRTGRLPEAGNALESLRMLGEADQRYLLGDIQVPTLISHGALDRIVPVAAGEYLAGRLPQAQLQRFEQVGHSPFFSRPHDCGTRWREFLR